MQSRTLMNRWLWAAFTAPLLCAAACGPEPQSQAPALEPPPTASPPAPQTPATQAPATQAPAAQPPAAQPPATPAAAVAVRTPKQVTGVAVSKTGRVFVNFPRWVDEPTPSVGEVAADGALTPYPDAAWNSWQKDKGDAKKQFVCVQSVFVDDTDTLWILDPAAPGFQGPVPGGPKLVKVSLASNKVERVYSFDAKAAPQNSYLNDVRIASGHAFMTDSGLGAIVVLNLATGAARRLLDKHPSTKAEAGVDPVIAGKPWRGADGKTPQVNSDGIALDPKREHLYYQALTGKTLYRVPVAALLDAKLSAEALGAKVERVATTQPSDGIEFDAQGNLYLTALEESAIKALRPDGKLDVVARSPEYEWPDSIAIPPSGELYFTTSQIHLMPGFNGGKDMRKPPYRVYRLSAAQLAAKPSK
jgi:sugar lactone lactonase YvrE